MSAFASSVVETRPGDPVRVLTAAEIVQGAAELAVDSGGRPTPPLVAVDLDEARRADPDTVADAMRALGRRSVVTVGIMRDPASTLAHSPVEVMSTALDTTLCGPGGSDTLPRWRVRVDDVDAELARLVDTARRVPRATVTLAGLLRLTETLSARDGLVAESLAAAMLSSGAEFVAPTDRSAGVVPAAGAVRVERDADTLRITLDSPETGNRLHGVVLDGLLAALEDARHDASIRRIDLSGTGSSFCAGGDVEEFTGGGDAPSAHLLGLIRSPGLAVQLLARRTVVRLHGDCVGAGIEVPAFAGHVLATPDTTVRLPALAAGLVPCAGGTVSITGRAGRWRTAYLALSDRAVDAETALSWRLIDEIVSA